jgi:polysaccharide export outer membrane protein
MPRLKPIPVRVISALAAWLLTSVPAFAQQAMYLIGPRDVLSINVWGQQDLSGKFTVEADGTFAFPLLGRVRAAGSSVQDVENRLKALLSDGYVRNAQVSVAMEQYRSQSVYVVGEVRQAGSYPLNGEMTLIEALALAGSTTDHAGGIALITRRGSTIDPLHPDSTSPANTLRINLRALQSGLLSENVVLHEGDVVFVPRTEPIFILGEVRTPGAFPLPESTTVLQAIAMAGGLTERGSVKRLRIVREVDGSKKDIKAKPDERLQAGDTLVVGERLF